MTNLERRGDGSCTNHDNELIFVGVKQKKLSTNLLLPQRTLVVTMSTVVTIAHVIRVPRHGWKLDESTVT